MLVDELRVETVWVPTDAGADLAAYDGVWAVPGSPYADDEAVLTAIRSARESGQPFLGTCGGFQYAVLESARSLLGLPATHAETEGDRPDNGVVELACSLQGEERLVTPVAGSWFASVVAEPFVGMHFCGFAPAAGVVDALVARGAEVGATAPDAGVELLRWPDHPFFVGSLFQPHVGALAGAPVHQLVRAFVGAARARGAESE
jgi:CTP synthase (UTP-ammonia lyase)